MYQALLRADIVSEILKELHPRWQDEDSTFIDLFNCAQVNKLFFQEATRVLWQGCGNHTPGVRHLAFIAKENPVRAQMYASHLIFIHFGFFEDGGKEGNYGPITFDTAYLDVLSSLRFPELELVTIYGTGERIEDRLLGCYLQPNLESFSLEGKFDGSLDTFLQTVTQLCPRIRNVHLGCEGLLTVRVRRFLEQNPQLNGFSLPPSQSEWSDETFKPICKMSDLQQLRVPHIEASWLDGIEAGWPELDQLRTTLSSESMEKLKRLAPNAGILELKIRSAPPPIDIFTELSKFSQLRLLDITLLKADGPREYCIDARDLITLARSCPQLFKLRIIGESDHPMISGSTDSMLEEMARNLPQVSEFCFDVDDTSFLTFNAIYALGKHCPQLLQARLSCNIEWTQYQETDFMNDISFDSLTELELVMRGHRLALDQWTDADREKVSQLGEHFVRAAPDLSSVEISGGNDADEYVNKVFNDRIARRQDERWRNSAAGQNV